MVRICPAFLAYFSLLDNSCTFRSRVLYDGLTTCPPDAAIFPFFSVIEIRSGNELLRQYTSYNLPRCYVGQKMPNGVASSNGMKQTAQMLVGSVSWGV